MSAVAHITIIELKENPVMIYIQGRESTEALHVIFYTLDEDILLSLGTIDELVSVRR